MTPPQSDAFAAMERFITRTMAMSHIYQPLMLKTLLESGGSASVRTIAANFLAADESQLEYYEIIVNRYPRATLRKHGMIVKDGQTYRLDDRFDSLGENERRELAQLCQVRIDAFLESRRFSPWAHRGGALDPVPGRVWFEVIERARRRCEACGARSDDKALHVDHIVPRSLGGSNDPDNLQALCVTCNLQKSNRSQTNFRDVERTYQLYDPDCACCRALANEQEVLAAVVSVASDFIVLAPRRHVPNYFDLGQAEVNALRRLELAVRNAGPPVIEVRILTEASVRHCQIMLVLATTEPTIPEKGQ